MTGYPDPGCLSSSPRRHPRIGPVSCRCDRFDSITGSRWPASPSLLTCRSQRAGCRRCRRSFAGGGRKAGQRVLGAYSSLWRWRRGGGAVAGSYGGLAHPHVLPDVGGDEVEPGDNEAFGGGHEAEDAKHRKAACGEGRPSAMKG
eukprot:scaffold713_cov114-Isochrysis_galbana.AAC.1